MSGSEPVKVLILETSQNRAEELIVLLRNTGRATRAHQIESEEDLLAALRDQAWDLCLAVPQVNDLTSGRAIGIIKEMERDFPVILIAEDNEVGSITEGLRQGATDVALEDDDERLALLIERELGNLESRRARRLVEVALRETERRCQLLLDTSMSAIAYVHDGMHIYANESYHECFGIEEMDELEGIPIIDLIGEEDQEQFKAFLRSKDQSEIENVELSCMHADGSKMMLQMSMCGAQYDGEPCTQVIFRNLTNDSELVDQLKELGSQDLVTGLYNRQHFMEQLDLAVDLAISGDRASIVFYVLVDRFDAIRKESGIATADMILGDMAEELGKLIAEEHVLARFGDDVFVLLFPGGDRDAALKLGEKMRERIHDHLFEVSGKTFHMTISIGMAMTSEKSTSGDEVISRAHHAGDVEAEGNFVTFYQKDAASSKVEDEEANTDEAIAHLLDEAISNGNLKLLFQPIINLHSDEEEQFEVLVRLPDAKGNDMRPAAFIDIAIEAGLAPRLDRWVTLQSIKVLAAHRREGSKARLFINITHKSMQDESFLQWIAQAFKAARLPRDALIFQMHESDVTTYVKPARKFAASVAQLHGKTSINHFGCSLNPFKTLQHLKVDYVKLDGSFAQGIDKNQQKKQELLDMVKSLQSQGVLTAISGVENPVVLSTLWEAGLNFIQGNYLSEPLENLDYDFNSEDM